MARYLFAWELGGDYGHLARLLPVALELRARGHEVVFAVRDLMGAEKLLTPHGLTYHQAPLWLRKVTQLPEAISYPELLMRFGYLKADALTGICRAWRNLITLLQPDVVVLDHAPTALLATRGLPLKRVNFGDGFCIPPRGRPMPHFRWWQRENMARPQDSEQHAVTTANQVLIALEAPTMAGLGELRECDDNLICTFAELDHYPQRDEDDYLGPIYSLGQGVDMAWPQADGPRIFAYLKPEYAGLDAILTALHKSGARVLAHVPGAAQQTLQKFNSSTGMVISAEPLNITRMGAGCDLALCHGGAGTTAAMLLAGKPLMVFPMQMEQAMAAHRLVTTGAAIALPPEASAQLPRLLNKALADNTLALAAQAFAQRHHGYNQQATIRIVADRCEAVTSTAPTTDTDTDTDTDGQTLAQTR
jgi:UDP:flavonoid glycosyltransferase YjiC (YdhE family)